MADTETRLFAVRAERIHNVSRYWSWAIYRAGSSTPYRSSIPIFLTDTAAIDAGEQVVADLRTHTSASRFVRPGI